MMYSRSHNSGFTLIELSIVLVVIGLLIGGILVAESLISTTKLQTAIKQIQQFDVAVNSFYSRYDALPGDAKAFGGNGDGHIAPVDSPSGWKFTSEVANFWVNLQSSGFGSPNKEFTATMPGGGFTTKGATPNAPTFDLDKSAGVIAYAYWDLNTGNLSGANTYAIGNWENMVLDGATAYISQGAGVIKGMDALALDAKIDDGNALTGIVTNSLFGYQLNCWPFGGCNNSGSYNDSLCMLSIGMQNKTVPDPVCIP